MRVIGDLECDGLLDIVSTIWCGVFKDLDTGEVYKFPPERMREMTRFLNLCKVVIGHNFIGYDEPVLKKVLNYTFPKDTIIIDTYILSQIIEPAKQKHPNIGTQKGPHSLENWGNYFNRCKPEHEDWSQFSDEMLHRCTEDVEINYLTFKALNRQADIFNPESDWYLAYKIESTFAKYFARQVSWGFLVDQDKINEHINYLTSEIDKIDIEVISQLPKRLNNKEKKVNGEYTYNKTPFKGNGELNQRTTDWCDNNLASNYSVIAGPFSRLSFDDFDLGSAAQVKDYLLSQGWVPEQWNFTRDPITQTLQRTSPKLSKDDPFNGVEGEIGRKVSRRMIYRHRRSQLEGFLRIVREDGRIPSDASGIADTARLKHRGVVNIPGSDAIFGNEMREVFIAPPGYVLVGCDAASCQLRDLCHHMGDPDFTDAVINGKSSEGTDVHSLTMKKTGLPHRTASKRFNYGTLFGAGPAKLSTMMNSALAEDGLDLRVSEPEAKKARDKFLKNLPKFKELLTNLTVQLRQYGFIYGIDRRHIFPDSEHKAIAYLLQSDEAIAMKMAYIFLNKWIDDRELDAHIVCFMHDEFQIEVREDQAEEVAKLAEKSIQVAHEYLEFNIPFKGEASIGKNWKETH